MSEHVCRYCGTLIRPGAAEHTLVHCPSCNGTFLRPDADVISGTAGATPDAQVFWNIALSPEFRAKYRLAEVRGGGFAGAERMFERAVAVKPDHVKALVGLTRVRDKMGKPLDLRKVLDSFDRRPDR